MKRGHSARRLDEIITAARRIIPDVSLRTTVIVGHPGESEEDFEELRRFVERVGFEHLGAFRYSDEEGTASSSQRDAVSKRDSYNRYRRIMALQRRISHRSCRSKRGTLIEVLVEGQSEESPLLTVGRHAGQAPEVDGSVFLDRYVEPGSMVTARVTDSGDYDLVAEVVQDR
jgi:ribosomal protein S12 methylthiotransferase